MSTSRQAIVDALNAVPGIVATPAPPDVPAPGSAWPSWTGAATGTLCTLLDSWRVYVCLPNATMLHTVEGADALVQEVWAALLNLADVSNVAPAQITLSDPAGIGQTLPALMYTMTMHARDNT